MVDILRHGLGNGDTPTMGLGMPLSGSYLSNLDIRSKLGVVLGSNGRVGYAWSCVIYYNVSDVYHISKLY